MISADTWLEAYGRGPARLDAGLLIWVCVPLSVFGLTGLLWSLPVPEIFSDAAVLNWGTIFLMATVVYYFIVSINLAFGALPFIVLDVAVVSWLDNLEPSLWPVSAAMLLSAAAVQLVAERLRGRSISLIRDLQYLMLGPLWLLAAVYRRLGIPY
jgi:hypothetical protein